MNVFPLICALPDCENEVAQIGNHSFCSKECGLIVQSRFNGAGIIHVHSYYDRSNKTFCLPSIIMGVDGNRIENKPHSQFIEIFGGTKEDNDRDTKKIAQFKKNTFNLII